MSSKDTDKGCVMNSKSDYIKIRIGKETDKFITFSIISF